MQDTDGTEPVAEPAAAEGDAMEIAPPRGCRGTRGVRLGSGHEEGKKDE